jgi:hypothetical protein
MALVRYASTDLLPEAVQSGCAIHKRRCNQLDWAISLSSHWVWDIVHGWLARIHICDGTMQHSVVLACEHLHTLLLNCSSHAAAIRLLQSRCYDWGICVASHNFLSICGSSSGICREACILHARSCSICILSQHVSDQSCSHRTTKKERSASRCERFCELSFAYLYTYTLILYTALW